MVYLCEHRCTANFGSQRTTMQLVLSIHFIFKYFFNVSKMGGFREGSTSAGRSIVGRTHHPERVSDPPTRRTAHLPGFCPPNPLPSPTLPQLVLALLLGPNLNPSRFWSLRGRPHQSDWVSDSPPSRTAPLSRSSAPFPSPGHPSRSLAPLLSPPHNFQRLQSNRPRPHKSEQVSDLPAWILSPGILP